MKYFFMTEMQNIYKTKFPKPEMSVKTESPTFPVSAVAGFEIPIHLLAKCEPELEHAS